MKLQIFILAMLCPFLSMCQGITIKGKVVDEEGRGLTGATVVLLPAVGVAGVGERMAVTNEKGEFVLEETRLTDTIVVSAMGYEPARELNNERGLITITLKRKMTALDEAVVMAYGSTSRRLNTGNIAKVKSRVLELQPVNNPLAALQGRVPGLVVTQSSGVPGASFRVQLRGKSSLAQGTEPLFIIDGVPFAPNNSTINQLSSAAASAAGNGISPLYSIDPSSIESIHVLKDADATAIYGSRGANGVILIQTKRGYKGKGRVEVRSGYALNQLVRTPAFLSTADYLAVRKEAFANDGLLPTAANAPDLVVWDSSSYTDFRKLLFHETTGSYTAQVSVSGGQGNTRYYIGGSYASEDIIYKHQLPSQRIMMQANLQTSIPDERLQTDISFSYSNSINKSTLSDITSYLFSPPNLPALYDSTGRLNWQYKGIQFENPLGFLQRKYKGVTDNMNGSLQVRYRVSKNFFLKSDIGYNLFLFEETAITPKVSQNPAFSPMGLSRFGQRRYSSWVAEPQAEYSFSKGAIRFSLLAGASLQNQQEKSAQITATGYTNDALLESLGGAGAYTIINQQSQYRYMAGFGRLNFQWKGKYLLTISGRRDGSSRFGPGRQWGNFAAAGAGWLFSQEPFARKLKWLSYGKLRMSYGSSGNDQISNYQYLDGWGTQSNPYQNVPGLSPARLFNPDYEWEVTQKWEGAIEASCFDERLHVELAYYRHRSGNQLIQYALPAQTGFTSIIANSPARIQNSGIEVSLQGILLKNEDWSFELQGNLSSVSNQLLAFPGLAHSSYANTYVVGQPITLLFGYKYEGVDPATGLYRFTDVNNDGVFNREDYLVNGNTAPRYYGGFGTTVRFKSWTLDLFGEYRKQIGRNYLLWQFSTNPPGGRLNLPVQYLQRWQKPGDSFPLQRYTTHGGSAAASALQLLLASDGIYSDASFIRIRNISVEKVNEFRDKKGKTGKLILYIRAQNLFTISRYEAGDPEVQHMLTLPPLKTIAMGFQLTL